MPADCAHMFWNGYRTRTCSPASAAAAAAPTTATAALQLQFNATSKLIMLQCCGHAGARRLYIALSSSTVRPVATRWPRCGLALHLLPLQLHKAYCGRASRQSFQASEPASHRCRCNQTIDRVRTTSSTKQPTQWQRRQPCHPSLPAAPPLLPPLIRAARVVTSSPAYLHNTAILHPQRHFDPSPTGPQLPLRFLSLVHAGHTSILPPHERP